MIEAFLAQRHNPNPPDERLLEALRSVSRTEFMHPALRSRAGEDRSVPIGWGQTISQATVVAQMTEFMSLSGTEHVLELGTGSGYQAAILSRLAKHVVTIERIPELARRAQRTLNALGYSNVDVLVGDGSLGVPERAPYDAIMITAAIPAIPQVLADQLKDGGRIVAPVGEDMDHQELVTIDKKGEELLLMTRDFVQFVTLEGEFGWPVGTNKSRYIERFKSIAQSEGVTPEQAKNRIASEFGLSAEELFGF